MKFITLLILFTLITTCSATSEMLPMGKSLIPHEVVTDYITTDQLNLTVLKPGEGYIISLPLVIGNGYCYNYAVIYSHYINFRGDEFLPVFTFTRGDFRGITGYFKVGDKVWLNTNEIPWTMEKVYT